MRKKEEDRNDISRVVKVNLLVSNDQNKKLNTMFKLARQAYNTAVAEMNKRLDVALVFNDFIEVISKEYNSSKNPNQHKCIHIKTKKNRPKDYINDCPCKRCHKRRTVVKYGLYGAQAITSRYPTQKDKNFLSKTLVNPNKKHPDSEPDWIHQHLNKIILEKIVQDVSQRASEVWRLGRGRPRYLKEINTLKGQSSKGKPTAIVLNESKTGLIIKTKNKKYELEILFRIANDKKTLEILSKYDIVTINITKSVKGIKDQYVAILTYNIPPDKIVQQYDNSKDVAVDIGVYGVAIVGENYISLQSIISKEDQEIIEKRQVKIKKLKDMDKNIITNRQRKKLDNLTRQEKEHKRNAHGQLIGSILKLGGTLHIENVNWSSVNNSKIKTHILRSAAGKFNKRLINKVETCGANLISINTWATKLSQHCICGHHCGKKGLDERVHYCPECGFVCQRDILSAILAEFTDDINFTDFELAQEYVEDNCSILRNAWIKAKDDGINCGTIKDIQAFCKVYSINYDDAECLAVMV